MSASHPDHHPSPAALEALYRLAVHDTLDQSASKRNADDLTDLRQALAAVERTASHLAGAVEALQRDNKELRRSADELRDAVAAALVDKKTLRTLQTHILQVDQRQSELETKHEEVERAFEQVAQLMEAGIEEAPAPAPPPPFRQQQQGKQQQQQQSDDPTPPREEATADTGFTNGQQPFTSQQRGSPRRTYIPPPRPQNQQHAARTRLHILQNGGIHASSPRPQSHQEGDLAATLERQQQQQQPPQGDDGPADSQTHMEQKQQSTTNTATTTNCNGSDPSGKNPRYKAFMNHFWETKRRHAEAGQMSKGKEREFVWSFVDGIKDKDTCQWVQRLMLETLPPNMVHRARKKGRPRNHSTRFIALGLDVTWDAVVNTALKRAAAPPFFA